MKKSVIILLSFLIPYFIVFFIPLITLGYVYKATIKTVEQELIDKNISLLNKNKDIINRHLEEIDTIIGQIEDIADIKSFSNVMDPLAVLI